ncbi:MAG: TraB/GumN family protein [Pseudomonadota bacterium]
MHPRRLTSILAAACRASFAAVALLIPLEAMAACAGRNLLDDLAAADPATHAAILAEGETVRNGGARLWRVVAPGEAGASDTTLISYLFGTYHDTGAHLTLSPAVEMAFEAATRLVVELDPASLEALAARVAGDPTFSLRATPPSAGERLVDRLPRAGRQAAEAALAARGLTLPMADRLAPWLLFSTLGVPACELSAMGAGAEVLDTRLMSAAVASGKPVTGLERYETALSAIDALPPDIAADMIVDALLMARHEEDVRATLMDSYAKGQIGTLWAASQFLGQRFSGRPAAEAERMAEAFDEGIIVARNRAWMAPLLPIMADGGAFVAVGALHLPGEAGLVALLRAEGYKVTPIDEGN